MSAQYTVCAQCGACYPVWLYHYCPMSAVQGPTVAPPPPRPPYRCPICGGRGSVDPGFYDNRNYPRRDTCRACDGKGVVR